MHDCFGDFIVYCLFYFIASRRVGISLGLVVPLTIGLAVLCIVCIAKVKYRTKGLRSSSTSRAAAVTNSQPPQCYVMTRPAIPPNQTGAKLHTNGVLYTTEPPTYASVIADDGRYSTMPLPPPYPGLDSKEIET